MKRVPNWTIGIAAGLMMAGCTANEADRAAVFLRDAGADAAAFTPWGGDAESTIHPPSSPSAVGSVDATAAAVSPEPDANGYSDAGLLTTVSALPDASRTVVMPVTWSQNKATIAFISPESCTAQFNRLFDCVFTSTTVDASLSQPGGFVHTDLRVRWEGDCSTQYEVTLRAEAPRSPTHIFVLRSDLTESVQADDGRAITRVTLSYVGSSLSYLNVDASCRAYLDVTFNTP